MPQPVSHSVDRLPGEGDDYMYLAKIQAAFQLDQDVLARLIRNIPSFIPGYWLTRIKLEDVIQDIARINGPFTCMDYDMASFHALQVADAAVNWYKPQNDGDLKHALEGSLLHLHFLHLAAYSAKGWTAIEAYQGWEWLMRTAFAQFLDPTIVSLQGEDLGFIKVILGNIVEDTARGYFMALSLINKTQAILWLHENGYPFHYDVQGLTMHIFEKTVPPVKKIAVDNADGNQPAASATASQPDQDIAQDGNLEPIALEPEGSIDPNVGDSRIGQERPLTDIKEVKNKIECALQTASLQRQEKKYFTALIARLDGATFEDAYCRGNPSTKSADAVTLCKQGKSYCTKAHQIAIIRLGVNFDIALIEGRM